MTRTGSIGLAAAAALLATPALAGEGFLGVYAHNVHDRLSLDHLEGGEQIVFGVRTASLDELSRLWKPHLHLLVGINTEGGTDYAAAGLDWRIKLFSDRFYIEPGLGVAIHTGRINLPSPYEVGISFAEATKRYNDTQTKLDLGSRVLFEPELALGWRATDRLSVELSWIHLSHGQLAGSQNPGLGDFGLRAVYRYGIDR